MLQLYKLKKAGYTIGNNDLPLQQWMELGELTDAIERMKSKDQLAALGNQVATSFKQALNRRSG